MSKKNKYIERAVRILREHKYTLLIDANGCEIWNCSRDGSSTYAFTIALLPRGISVCGDIGELMFGVRRDIHFLAGQDVEYYIHSKLVPEFEEEEFDEDALHEIVIEEIVEAFNNEVFDSNFSEIEYLKISKDIEKLDFKNMVEYFTNISEDNSFQSEGDDIINDLCNFLYEVDNVGTLDEAFNTLNTCDVIDFDCFESAMSKASESLLNRLYLVNQAAISIINQKNMEKADAKT